jgi:hypothetical protein
MKNIFIMIAGLLSLSTFAYCADLGRSGAAFDHAEYLKATSTGKKQAVQPIKGILSFDSATKSVEFHDKKDTPAFSIKYDSIRSILYEETSTPRYAAALIISPLFIFSHEKKHYLTIQFTDASGVGHYAIVHLDKKNAREVVAAAGTETGKTVERAVEN